MRRGSRRGRSRRERLSARPPTRRMRSSPRPNNNSRPNSTRLLLEGDGTLLD
jgi:hypothetical protein